MASHPRARYRQNGRRMENGSHSLHRKRNAMSFISSGQMANACINSQKRARMYLSLIGRQMEINSQSFLIGTARLIWRSSRLNQTPSWISEAVQAFIRIQVGHEMAHLSHM